MSIISIMFFAITLTSLVTFAVAVRLFFKEDVGGKTIVLYLSSVVIFLVSLGLALKFL